MGLNKFITKKGRVLLDLTGDTVTPETLGKGVTAHNRSGDPIVGTMEGGGGGGGECSGVHINVVDELPEVGVEGAYYGVKTFADVYVVMGENKMFYSQAAAGMDIAFAVATSTTMRPIDGPPLVFYYLTDIPDVYLAIMGDVENAISLSAEMGLPFNGVLTDIAEATEDGYYAYMGGLILYQYRDGTYVRLLEQGSLKFTSNEDGTCYVGGVGQNPESGIVIPSVSPNGDTVTEIGYGAFQNALIKSVTIPDTVTDFGKYAFANCVALEKAVLPNTMFTADSCFLDCYSLTDVTLSNVAEIIRFSMFENCISLKSIFIPASVIHLQENAFKGCINLETITFGGTVARWYGISDRAIGNGWNDGIPAKKVVCADGDADVTPIRFKVNIGYTYTSCYAEEGMTWAEFVNCGYGGSTKFTVGENDTILYNNSTGGQYIVADGDAQVHSGDVIIADKEYQGIANS